MVNGIMTSVLLFVLIFAQGAVWAANYADRGDGLYKGDILWLTWGGGQNGTADINIFNNQTSSATINVSGSSITLSCRIENIRRAFPYQCNQVFYPFNNCPFDGVKSYRPGDWRGDGFDNLYHIFRLAGNNRLIAGISNRSDDIGADTQFETTCTATVDGQPYEIPGLVIAEAEQSAGIFPPGSSFDRNDEYVTAQADGNWHLIDRFIQSPQCPVHTKLTVSGTKITHLNENIFGGNNNAGFFPDECSAFSLIGGGPMAVTYLDYNSTAYQGLNRAVTNSFEVYAGGRSAIAIGMLLPTDFGDAPSSYGQAAHLFDADFNNPLSSGTIDAFTTSLATRIQPDLRLGSIVDAESTLTGNTNANKDDNNATLNDEDSITTFPFFEAQPGLTYSVPGIPVYNNTGSAARFCGWIDFDINGQTGDGSFENTTPGDGVSERACVTVGGSAGADPDNGSCSGSAPNFTCQLDFVVPNDFVYNADEITYARFRLTTSPEFFTANSPNPVGVVADGEVEDHIIAIGTLPVTLSHVDSTRNGSYITFDWSTSSELFNVGYQLWGLNGSDQKWEKLHGWLIRSGSGNAVEPQSYSKTLRIPNSIDNLSALGISSVDSDAANITTARLMWASRMVI